MKLPFTIRVERANYNAMRKRAKKEGLIISDTLDKFLVWFATAPENEIWEFMKKKHFVVAILVLSGVAFLLSGYGEKVQHWATTPLEMIDEVMP